MVGAGGRRGVFRCMSFCVHRLTPSAGIALAPNSARCRHHPAATPTSPTTVSLLGAGVADPLGGAVTLTAKKLLSRKLGRGASLAQILRCRDRRLGANGGEPSASIIPTLSKV